MKYIKLLYYAYLDTPNLYYSLYGKKCVTEVTEVTEVTDNIHSYFNTVGIILYNIWFNISDAFLYIFLFIYKKVKLYFYVTKCEYIINTNNSIVNELDENNNCVDRSLERHHPGPWRRSFSSC